MSTKPPASPVPATSKPDASRPAEPRVWKWFERISDLYGIGAVVIFVLLGWSRLRLAGAIPLPDVPLDGGQLARIEALAERASAIAMANQHLIEMIVCFAAAAVVFFVTVRLDDLSGVTKALRRENEELREQIGEYEDRELQELKQGIAEMEQDVAELRQQRLQFLASIFGPDAQRHSSPFDDPNDEDDDDTSPFAPPKKPPFLN